MNAPGPYRDNSEASRIYFLPNLFTAGNLFFGFLAIIRCVQANKPGSLGGLSAMEYYTQGVWCIVLAALFDFVDGRVARFSGRMSLFGAEFDSLSDLVSFGVAPALLVFFLILSPSGGNYPIYLSEIFLKIGWLVSFIYLLCCAARLARFNVITSPLLPKSEKISRTHDFIGLPVPAAAGIIASIAVILIRAEVSYLFAIMLLPLMLLVSFLMVSSIQFPSFKYISWNLKTGFSTFLTVAALLALLIFFSIYSLAIVFFSYLFFGLFRQFWHWRHSRNLSMAAAKGKHSGG